ncbi:MAG TPA: ABC transporter ATP-binding protein [Desulfobacteraceae bacterium]|nr:ABC transporter ATP-binding protein [Desulfobacteraceae bacterium]HPJ68634.1 ABC transporter ATP-binding protein [Desulfobacteraceae bacterium]HPQ27541.1 ABC transporter ATP-binding protein [Desulfobacteraceae bacterium]
MSYLSINNIGKAYKRYARKYGRLAEWLGLGVHHELRWVLQNITLDVNQGESVGIVGVNGAGKSTLLKIITGTTRPTTGTVEIDGRISALLELGMGFHPDFTGRQNAYMSAQLAGLKLSEINGKIDEIEAFAEVGDYFNQPMRTYSTGMHVRVAFAVATCMRPEILIVDEALSVGDAYFQHKSFSRIREFREEGTTLLFVSHDRGAIQSLCDRAILLEDGIIIKDGNPEEVMDFYNALIAEKENSTVEVRQHEVGKVQTRSGTGEAVVEEIGLYNAKGEPVEFVTVGEPVELRVKAGVLQSLETLVFGYGIKDRLGQVMYGTNTWHTKQVIHNPQAGDEYLFTVSFSANLGVGSYSVEVALHDRDTHMTANYEWLNLALVFNVVNVNRIQFVGSNWMEPTIEIESK